MYKKKIVVLFGGKSKEHNISLCSASNIINNINYNLYDVFLIGINKYGKWILYHDQKCIINPHDPFKVHLLPSKNYVSIIPGINAFQLLTIHNRKKLPKIDAVFPVLHGKYGEDGSIQGLLNMLNIPCIGSDILSSAICMDKYITKKILLASGIQTVPSILLYKYNIKNINFFSVINKLGLPLFIKPTIQGSSIGIHYVRNVKDFYSSIQKAFKYDKKILIEKAILGKEIEIGIIGKNNVFKVSVCGEIIYPQNTFYTFNQKYTYDEYHNTQKYIIPAQITDIMYNNIKKISIQTYKSLFCNIFARIDFFIDNQNKIFINEVHTMPGFTLNSIFPKLWEMSGINNFELVNKLISLSL